MLVSPYLEQVKSWPAMGQRVLAQFDAETITVYQAYRPEIADWAVSHQRFGGPFSFNRMSWVKPNFLWMMYRSGWGTKVDQERTLAVTLRREGFEQILERAVLSSFKPAIHREESLWKEALARSDVRLQWDPDHDPLGQDQQRRALQLGLSGDTLKHFGTDWVVRIDDVSAFVAEQRPNAARAAWPQLMTPAEAVFEVTNEAVRQRLGVDAG